MGYNLSGNHLFAGEEDVKDNCDALPGNYKTFKRVSLCLINNFVKCNFSGGSLIAEDTLNQQNRYAYLVGIYSFGFGICGNSGFPGVYTV